VSEVRIAAELRTEFGKGAARRIRRAHKVPAVIYGHGTQPRHISLPGHELMLALKNSNVLLELDIEGERELTLPKSVQRHPVRGLLEHVDLVVVRRGERVKVDVPIQTIGEIAAGALLTNELTELSVEAEATNIPAAIEVIVEGLAAGAQIYAKDIILPSAVSLVTDPEQLVLHVSAAPTAEEVEAELAEAEGAVGIEREVPAEEPAAAAPAEPESAPVGS
jgi:large subunit ribosomal protein L25